MKRALIYASVASMIQQFNMENIRLLIDIGYQVDVACNMKEGSTISAEKVQAMEMQLQKMGCRVCHIPIPRRITDLRGIIQSFTMTRKLLNSENYDLIHCHSPIGGMVCRLANRCSHSYKNTKMVYTAHGFHFYKGAPRKNWILFYPMERFCGRFTDTLITINKEDYALAKQKFHLKKNGKIEYVPGIGIDLKRITAMPEIKDELRKDLHISKGDIILLSVGELNDNKNHVVVLKAMSHLPSNIHYIICGQGSNKDRLKALAENLNLKQQLHLLGYCDNVPSIVKSCDLFVFPSRREGLSVALMEAMACGKAVACSKIRGNTDLIDEKGGALFDPENSDSCMRAIKDLLNRDLTEMGNYNRKKVEGFSREKVEDCMRKIYCE